MSDTIFFENKDSLGIEKNTEIEKWKNKQKELFECLYHDDFSIESWIETFKSFSEKHKRFLYSSISADILQSRSEDEITILNKNIQTLAEKTGLTLSDEERKLLHKLFDHCNLAVVQRNVYNQTKKEIQNITEESFSEKFKSYEKEITAQLISLISIFTALSFVVFGGISILDSLLENTKQLPVVKLFIVGNVWFLCMYNIFALFLKFICKMVNKEIKLNIKIPNIIAAAVFLVIILYYLVCSGKIIMIANNFSLLFALFFAS